MFSSDFTAAERPEVARSHTGRSIPKAQGVIGSLFQGLMGRSERLTRTFHAGQTGFEAVNGSVFVRACAENFWGKTLQS